MNINRKSTLGYHPQLLRSGYRQNINAVITFSAIALMGVGQCEDYYKENNLDNKLKFGASEPNYNNIGKS